MKQSLSQFWRRLFRGRGRGLAATLALGLLSLSAFQAQAVINADRTRVIFYSKDKAVSVGLENSRKDIPYLAQAWVDNEDNSRSKTLIALPPLQRIDGGQRSQVRVMQIKEETAKLPQDRESLFYFNVLGVPPKSDEVNVVQLAQQSRLKLFYRPQALGEKKDEPERNLVILHNDQGVTLKNPTAYYVSLVALGSAIGKNFGTFDNATIAPFSQQALPGITFSDSHIYVGYVDDYGGLKINQYHCTISQCEYSVTQQNKAGGKK